jgi:hypothetical protein
MAGNRVTATRDYLWVGQGRHIKVQFMDQTLLQQFDLGAENPSDLHLCGADNYDGSYIFDDWPIWQATWRVNGPRKNYTMVTRFSRHNDVAVG